MIEIDLSKLERGTHTGNVKVTRKGKTFYRKQRIGQKEVDKKDTLSIYKNTLTKMDSDELKQQIDIIHDEYPQINKAMDDWYHGFGEMSLIRDITTTFRMSPESVDFIDKKHSIDKKTIEGYKKMYYITQQYLKSKNIEHVIAYRGVGLGIDNEFEDKEVGEFIDIKQYNVSSWSTEPDMAKEFAENHKDGGVVLMTFVPINKVFIHPDCPSEYSSDFGEDEIIVMGSEIECSIVEFYSLDDNKEKYDEDEEEDDNDDWKYEE